MYDIDTLAHINGPEPEPAPPLPERPESCSCEEAEYLMEMIRRAMAALMDPEPGCGYMMTIDSVAEADRILTVALTGKEPS